jgi:hypothetical protein
MLKVLNRVIYKFEHEIELATDYTIIYEHDYRTIRAITKSESDFEFLVYI